MPVETPKSPKLACSVGRRLSYWIHGAEVVSEIHNLTTSGRDLSSLEIRLLITRANNKFPIEAFSPGAEKSF